jgi:hypothetical protein
MMASTPTADDEPLGSVVVGGWIWTGWWYGCGWPRRARATLYHQAEDNERLTVQQAQEEFLLSQKKRLEEEDKWRQRVRLARIPAGR